MFLKSLITLLIFIVLIPITVVECDPGLEDPEKDLKHIINTFNETEIERFNRILVNERLLPEEPLEDLEEEEVNQRSNLLPRLMLFVVINISLYIVLRYGSSIINSIAEGIPNALNGGADYLSTAARDAALHAVANATPNQRMRLLVEAQNIVLDRH